jgi:hypothetical protein
MSFSACHSGCRDEQCFIQRDRLDSAALVRLASRQSEEMKSNYRPQQLYLGRVFSMSTEIASWGAWAAVEQLPLPTIGARFALC